MDETEAAQLLAHEEVRLRSVLMRLESGGVVEHSGAEEHLAPLEEHFPDDGAEIAERSLELGLLDSIESELRDVDRARTRLREGRFGRCTTCGGPIGDERLRASPGADHCVTCARRQA